MMTVIEEYWLPIRFRTIREQIEETLASGRKEGEFLVLVTQQPEQAQRSADLFPAIRSLVATHIYLADPNAEFEPYQRKGFTRKEFDEFKKLTKASRKFLIKQGNQSAFASFDLRGMDDEVAILSGDRENVLILDHGPCGSGRRSGRLAARLPRARVREKNAHAADCKAWSR